MPDDLAPGTVPEDTAHPSALGGDRPPQVAPDAATSGATALGAPTSDRTAADVNRDLGATPAAGGIGLSPGAQSVQAVDHTISQYIERTYADPAQAQRLWASLDQAGRDRLLDDPTALGPLRQGVRPESVMTGGLAAGSAAVAQADPNDVREARQPTEQNSTAQGTDRSVADGARRDRQATPAEAMNDQLSKALDIRQLTI
jgi:hypothetical protein